MPGNFQETFMSHKAPLYVGNRQWTMAAAEPLEEFSYEQLLHSHYWPGCANEDYPLIVIKGKEGGGKSTFIRFYFDCYLPHYGHFIKARQDDSSPLGWQEQLKKHIILYADLHQLARFEDARDHIFKQFRKTIYDNFPRISVDENYAMWHRLARWNEPARRKAEETSPDKDVYRARWVDNHLDNNEEFVKEALWYINSQKNSTEDRKYYIIQIFDNMDQLDIDIQKNLLIEILQWIKHDRCQWKVIIPLRPETLRQIVHVVGPIQSNVTIELGNVDYGELLKTRRYELESQIRDSGKQIERDRFVGRLKTIVFQPIPNFLTVEYLQRMLDIQIFKQTSQLSTDISTHPFSAELLAKFCNGSIRRLLRVLNRIMVSVPIQHAAEQQELHKGKPIPHYTFLNAWLTGKRDFFDENDEENDIVNLFNVANLEPSAHTLLIGIHIAHLLLHGQCSTISKALSLLTQIGYKQDEICECLDYLHKYGFFKRETVDQSGAYRIQVENDIVEAHLRLVEEPAYIDNMALVTPVREDFSRLKMSHTVSYSIKDFRERVSTSFHFIHQIRDDERVVRTWRSDSPRHRMKSDMFVRAFNELNLPSVYKKIAVSYHKRLQMLSSNPMGLSKVMNARRWDSLLREPILDVNREEADKPLTAIVHKSGSE